MRAHPPPPPIRRNGRKGELLLGGFTQGSAKTAWRNHWADCCNLVEFVRYAALRAVGGAKLLREKLRVFAHFSFRDVSRFYAQIRAVFTRFYAFLRVGVFFLDANFANERELGTDR